MVQFYSVISNQGKKVTGYFPFFTHLIVVMVVVLKLFLSLKLSLKLIRRTTLQP